ncbi:hypothetical protein [Haliangium ochraceum]|uniref:Uncharacterized protein n=1 Tax=Haliangium ochraceum (strain DSM 14365 / JCM 11303 / SMP-2) TaxID=502025 RepID=D0LXZ0_HALO1|nr:hypothetical protein [Haliangium ochraceum]ACY14345.1 hypothetical protein Hoch_1797 [Haliangium ochraceum DSM 14365]
MSASSEKQSARRVPGWALVLVCIALVAITVFVAGRTIGARPAGTSIVELVAIDREYAALVRNTNEEGDRFFLSLLHTERGEAWGALLPRSGPWGGPRGNLAATADVISVRARTGGVPYAHMFAAARGAKLGRYRLDVEGDEEMLKTPLPVAEVPRVGVVADAGQSFEFLRREGEAVTVVAIDLEHGRRLWRAHVGAAEDDLGEMAPVWLRRDALLVFTGGSPGTGGRLDVLARDTGARLFEPLEDIEGVPCVLGERVYASARGRIWMTSLSDAAVRDLGPSGDVRGTGVCGHRGERDFVVVSDKDAQAALLAFTPGASAPVPVPANGDDGDDGDDGDSDEFAVETVPWSALLPLGGALRVDGELLAAAPDAAMLGTGAAAPSFVPLLVGEAGAPQLIIVDLDELRVVRRSQPAAALAGARIVLADGRFYLWTPAPLLAAFGDQGEIAAAVALDGMAPVWPKQFADGHVWVYRSDDAERPLWLVLEGATLRVRAAGLGTEVDVEPPVLNDAAAALPALR